MHQRCHPKTSEHMYQRVLCRAGPGLPCSCGSRFQARQQQRRTMCAAECCAAAASQLPCAARGSAAMHPRCLRLQQLLAVVVAAQTQGDDWWCDAYNQFRTGAHAVKWPLCWTEHGLHCTADSDVTAAHKETHGWLQILTCPRQHLGHAILGNPHNLQIPHAS